MILKILIFHQLGGGGGIHLNDLFIINPLMTALSRSCWMFLNFCTLAIFRVNILCAKNEVRSTCGSDFFLPSHICDTGHMSIQICNNKIYL